jgi:hypothetical protein
MEWPNFFRNILLFALKKHYIFYMRRVWEHVHRLYSNYAILYVKVLKITCLSGRITADVDDAFWCRIEDGLYDVGVHACTGWVSDNDIRPTVFLDEIVSQNVLHVPGIEQRVLDTVNL